MKPIQQFVEVLEPRIAPAVLVNGGNLLGGKGNPTTGETSSGGNNVTLITVLSGQALVFYDADTSEISSISVGNHTKLDIVGDVQHDIITNLAKNGRLTDADGDPSNGEDGGILLPSKIDGITTHPLSAGYGSIGRIIAGGSISNILTSSDKAQIQGIYAGDGIFRNGPVATVSTGAIDYNTIESGAQNTFVLQQGNGRFQPTASITTVKISIGRGLEIFSGSGASVEEGAGGVGGSITGVDIVKSFAGSGNAPAISLYAGDGGRGASGGDGGSISGFTDEGSTTLVRIQTGHGGQGFDGNGGKGGSFLNSTITTQSPAYNFLIGDGGDGSAHGGKGGTIKGLSFTASIISGQTTSLTGGQTSTTLITNGDFNGDGLDDAVVINATSGDAIVSLATPGSATAFTPVIQPNGAGFISPQGITATDVVTGDFNGDGQLDYAVSYANSNNLGIFLNQGGGIFQSSQVGLSSSPYRLVSGLFNDDNALDLAYLALPAGGSSATAPTSQIFAVNNDGTGQFSQQLTGVSIAGTASDLVAAPINADTRTDLFVSLDDASGTINVLFATANTSGAPFVQANTIQSGAAHITNLDTAVFNDSLHLLAFSKNTASTTTTTTTDSAVTPALRLVTVDGVGRATSIVDAPVIAGSTLARFIGTNGDYGVLTATSVQVSSLGGSTSKSYTVTDGTITSFTPLGDDGSDSIAAVGPVPTRLFYSDGNTLASVALPVVPQVFTFKSGNGGHGGDAGGGKGGAIKTLTFSETLDGGVDTSGGTYSLILTSGDGGGSDAGAGGDGGGLTEISVSLDPANSTLLVDDTTLLSLHAGRGGDGASGGNGGGITKLTATTLLDETRDMRVTINSLAAELYAGNGGVGTQTRGGNGGSVTLDGKASLTGVTHYDAQSSTPFQAGLIVVGGSGGQGATGGGAGGSLVNIGTQNAPVQGGSPIAVTELASARLIAGNGGEGLDGNGGKGGDLITLDVSVQRTIVSDSEGFGFYLGGSVGVRSGDGGRSAGGIGGSGGKIEGGTLASVQGDLFSGYGVLVLGGSGSDGTLGGGRGGGVHKLNINSPSNAEVYAAAIIAGDGGSALESGASGVGGTIKGVTQTKDVNSSINLLLAGNGGAGGVGGSVKNVKTVGFIGLPSSFAQQNLGVFNSTVESNAIAAQFPNGLAPQGVFAGRGEGGNGSVANIDARQIAAIGAAPDANGIFGLAESVSKITADLIGFEVTRDNVFESSVGGASPSSAVPVDGFILAAAVEEINTINDSRTAAFTFLG